MKLSVLYTEQLRLNEAVADKIKGLLSRRQNPKTQRVRAAIEQAFDDVVRSKPVMDLDDAARQMVQKRLIAYKQTLLQTPEVARSKDPLEIARGMMAKRAARYVRNYGNPNASFRNLGLKPEWYTHDWS
jgi:hypothetical protein